MMNSAYPSRDCTYCVPMLAMIFLMMMMMMWKQVQMAHWSTCTSRVQMCYYYYDTSSVLSPILTRLFFDASPPFTLISRVSMSASHFVFGISFLLVFLLSSLLLPFTLFPLFLSPSSLPIRRSFFSSASPPPLLSSLSEIPSLFRFSIPPSWPHSNLIYRLFVSFACLLCAFSFAPLLSFYPNISSSVLLIGLSIALLLAFGGAIWDIVLLARLGKDCQNDICPMSDVTLIAENVTCTCQQEVWFWFTVVVEILLVIALSVCVAMTVGRKGKIARRVVPM